MKIRGLAAGILLLSAGAAQAQGIDSFISKQIQDQVSRQVSAGISKNLNENLLIPQLKIRNASGEVEDFTLSSDNRYYNLLHRDGSVRVWDAKQGVQRPAIRLEGDRRFSKVVSSAKSAVVWVGGEDGKVYGFDILTAKPLTVLNTGDREAVVAMSIADAADRLAVAYRDGTVIVWSLQNFSKIVSLTSRQEVKHLLLTADGNSLLIAGDEGFVEWWNGSGPLKTAVLPKPVGDVLGIWTNGNGDWLYLDSLGQLYRLEQSSDRFRLQKQLASDLRAAALNVEGRILALFDGRQIRLFDFDAWSLRKEIAVTDSVSQLRFINQGRQLIAADSKGVLHVWDTDLAVELLKLISTDSGWTVVDNAGRFDSSEGGMPNVSWLAADQDIPIDNFSSNYYEPGLLATHLDNDAFINRQPRKIQEGITLPPAVNLKLPTKAAAGDEVEVSFEIADRGGGIGEHRFYHNGKIVARGAEDSRDSEVGGQLQRKVTYNVVASSGSNQFKVVAANRMGIDSIPQQAMLQAPGEEAGAKLHVLAVGINKYEDDKLDLAYSVADARAIASTLSHQRKPVFPEITSYDLLDDGATKTAIVEQLAKIAEDSQNDVLVVYFAGHGIAIGGEWYFLPHETLYRPDEHYITKVGISATQIQDLLAKIPAQKILVMIDSCYSGAGLKSLGELQKSQRHFSRALSKSVGIVVLAATRQDQEALELTELGHGLFTYVVNNGMQGEADVQPKDHKISAYEVADYAKMTIPSFAKQYADAAQEPVAFTLGEDFVLLAR